MSVIVRNKNGFVGNLTPSYRKYSRPEDWLDMPSISEGEEVIYMLTKVYEQGSNYIAFKAQGDYQVDWGDGTITTHASNSDAQHDIQWSGVSSSTLTSGGYRQAMVKITPQSGSSLTYFRYANSLVHTDDVYISLGGLNDNTISVKMAGQNFNDLNYCFYKYRVLEEFEFVGSNVITNLSNTFRDCDNLRKIIQFDTSTVTNFDSAFRSCYRLLEVPQFDTTNGTSLDDMFRDCWDIEYIPPITPSSEDTLSQTFRECRSLKNVPIADFTGIQRLIITFFNNKIKVVDVNLPDVTNINQPFAANSELEVLNMTIPDGQLTNASYVFNGLKSLKQVKPFDTSNCTGMEGFFYNSDYSGDISWVDTSSNTDFYRFFRNCKITDSSNIIVSSAATDVIDMYRDAEQMIKVPETMDLTNVTSTVNMFDGCKSMITPPTFINTSGVTDTYLMFRDCKSMEKAPEFDTSNCTRTREMFSGCINIPSAPSYDLSSVVSYPNNYRMFYYCSNLRESNVTGATTQHSYDGCQLSRSEIVNVFNNLGINTDGRSIYVNRNPGTSELTAGDISIATGKGWTVVS